MSQPSKTRHLQALITLSPSDGRFVVRIQRNGAPDINFITTTIQEIPSFSSVNSVTGEYELKGTYKNDDDFTGSDTDWNATIGNSNIALKIGFNINISGSIIGGPSTENYYQGKAKWSGAA